MKNLIMIYGLMSFYLISFSQETGTLSDPRDGKVYKTVKIGSQWVMAENLTYKPEKGVCWGDTIYFDKSHFKGTDAAKNGGILILDSSSVKRYGYFYDFETANAIAIKGWHVPTKDEWKALCKYLGGNPKKVYSTMIEGGNSGFNAVLSGLGGFVNGNEKGRFMIDQTAGFWSSTKSLHNYICIGFTPPATRFNSGFIGIGIATLYPGRNVRLFKDN